jgi:protein XagA
LLLTPLALHLIILHQINLELTLGKSEVILRFTCVKIMFCSALFGLSATQSTSYAGSFMQNEGEGQAISSINIMEAHKSFNPKGIVTKTAPTQKIEASLFIEYGVREWLTVFVQPNYIRNQIGEPINATYSGLGYSEFGGRIRILQSGTFVLSAQSSLRLPKPSDIHNVAQTGNIGSETDNRILAGKSFEFFGRSSFTDVNIGYRTRGGQPANEWRSDVTFGTRPMPEFLPKLMLLVQSFNAVSDGRGLSSIPRTSSSKLQLSAVYDVTKQWSVQLGGYTTLIGRNYNRETGAVASVWRKF